MQRRPGPIALEPARGRVIAFRSAPNHSQAGLAMPKDEVDDQGFTVTDKRMFREDGELRSEAAASESHASAKEPRAKETPPQSAPPPSLEEPPGTGPKIDFPSYVLGYYTQALVFLGEVASPVT